MSFLDKKISLDLSKYRINRYSGKPKHKKVKSVYNPDQGIGKNGAKKYLKQQRDGERCHL